ncbi:MAG TPA: cytochrome c-type biogenesis protein CcmH [Bryobacteraceae bacterium]|nr:cytochrome c-type biogenesis protein CcmH [Bryobacteraceae bacterium]
MIAALLTMGQGDNPLLNVRVRQLGEQLGCQCGCGASVTSCNMLQCHFALPARQKLLKMVEAGESDQAILASFVRENGPRILLKPPAEGFNLVGWLMPFAALVAGLAFLWWVIKRFRKPLAPAGGPALDDSVLERYRERIDKDTENLD